MPAVQLSTVQPMPIAAVRRQTTIAEIPNVLIPALDIVWAFIRGRSLQHGHNVAIYRMLGGRAVDMVCGVEVTEPFDGVGEVIRAETPGGQVATMTHVGAYDRLPGVYSAIADWALQNNHRLAGVSWEVYGDWNEDPAKLETQVCMLVEPS